MQEHSLERLLKLVDTAYYRQNGSKAVCEILAIEEDGYAFVTLFVNGQLVHVRRGSVEGILREFNLSLYGWTTRPQLA